MNMSSQQRLQDLESRFMDLDKKIKNLPEKEVISVLHAMLQEALRNVPTGPEYSQHHSDGKSLEDIVNLYKHAPEMKGDAENGGLEVGIKAPDFSLPDANKRTVRLSDFRGKNVILCFYPLDWSPACSDQLSLYQSELNEFERCNTQLLCISVDNIYSHGAWSAVRGLTFPSWPISIPRAKWLACIMSGGNPTASRSGRYMWSIRPASSSTRSSRLTWIIFQIFTNYWIRSNHLKRPVRKQKRNKTRMHLWITTLLQTSVPPLEIRICPSKCMGQTGARPPRCSAATWTGWGFLTHIETWMRIPMPPARCNGGPEAF